MGFESFRVELRGPTPIEQVREAILALPHVQRDPEGGFPFAGSEYYSVRDGRHVFELELSQTLPHQTRVSLRFTLSHPPSVDSAFLQLVRRLMTDSGLRAFVLDDSVMAAFPDGFGLWDDERFAEFAFDAIEVERWAWISQFGPETLTASTAEVFEQIILPRCEPTPALKVSR